MKNQKLNIEVENSEKNKMNIIIENKNSMKIDYCEYNNETLNNECYTNSKNKKRFSFIIDEYIMFSILDKISTYSGIRGLYSIINYLIAYKLYSELPTEDKFGNSAVFNKIRSELFDMCNGEFPCVMNFCYYVQHNINKYDESLLNISQEIIDDEMKYNLLNNLKYEYKIDIPIISEALIITNVSISVILPKTVDLSENFKIEFIHIDKYDQINMSHEIIYSDSYQKHIFTIPDKYFANKNIMIKIKNELSFYTKILTQVKFYSIFSTKNIKNYFNRKLNKIMILNKKN